MRNQIPFRIVSVAVSGLLIATAFQGATQSGMAQNASGNRERVAAEVNSVPAAPLAPCVDQIT